MAAKINEAAGACVLQAVRHSTQLYKPVISLFLKSPSATPSRVLCNEDGKWERSDRVHSTIGFAKSFREWLGTSVWEDGRHWEDVFVMLIKAPLHILFVCKVLLINNISWKNGWRTLSSNLRLHFAAILREGRRGRQARLRLNYLPQHSTWDHLGGLGRRNTIASWKKSRGRKMAAGNFADRDNIMASWVGFLFVCFFLFFQSEI